MPYHGYYITMVVMVGCNLTNQITHDLHRELWFTLLEMHSSITVLFLMHGYKQPFCMMTKYFFITKVRFITLKGAGAISGHLPPLPFPSLAIYVRLEKGGGGNSWGGILSWWLYHLCNTRFFLRCMLCVGI